MIRLLFRVIIIIQPSIIWENRQQIIMNSRAKKIIIMMLMY